MISHRKKMNCLPVKIICSTLVVFMLSSTLTDAAGRFCRGIDCRTDIGQQMCRVCARPPPGKRTETPSVRELFSARLDDPDDEQFSKYSDPDLSNTCVLESVLRRVSPRLRTEIVEILEDALGFAVEDLRKWSDD